MLAVESIFTGAEVVFGWTLAATILAVLVAPLVAAMHRFLPRIIAVLIVFAIFAGGAVALREAYLGEVRTQVTELAERGPRAAGRVEARDDRIGRIATDFELSDRVSTLTGRLADGVGTTADELRVAARSVPAYLLTFILAIFLLYFGPRLVRGGFGLLDEQRRLRWQSAMTRAVRAAQIQVGASLALSVGSGALAWFAARLLSLPAPGLFGLFAAAAMTVPYLGTTLGWLPLVLFGFGVAPLWQVLLVLVSVGVLQLAEIRGRRVLDEHTVYVGPAVVILSAALGYALEGIGGMLVLVPVAVFGVAVADAIADEVVTPWTESPASSAATEPLRARRPSR